MDAQTYSSIVAMCAGLAGRLSDDVLGVVREHYSAGEWELAESALLLGLRNETIGITGVEADAIRSVLEDPNTPDLAAVTIIEALPPRAYSFQPTGPSTAPTSRSADQLLSAAAPRHGGLDLRRAWREPLADVSGTGTWTYLLLVVPGTDELPTYAGLSSELWVGLHEKWPVEVVAMGCQLSPYQAAVWSVAQPVWSAAPMAPPDQDAPAANRPS
ncbi:hypothetical protein ACFFWC_28065 [Plantactinospora siamensis]|uniref:Uncharacterized protein n=1 Tax=Plantactinospora siamensis TaxID=555372 RepID=A0ABV6NS26_9ACTN